MVSSLCHSVHQIRRWMSVIVCGGMGVCSRMIHECNFIYVSCFWALLRRHLRNCSWLLFPNSRLSCLAFARACWGASSSFIWVNSDFGDISSLANSFLQIFLLLIAWFNQVLGKSMFIILSFPYFTLNYYYWMWISVYNLRSFETVGANWQISSLTFCHSANSSAFIYFYDFIH